MDDQCHDCKEVCGSRLVGYSNIRPGAGRQRLIAAVAIFAGALLVLVLAAILSAPGA
jgi:hypothetical protein